MEVDCGFDRSLASPTKNMEHNKTLTELLGEVQRNADALQKAVAEVGQVKASLKTTASDVKSQIRDSVSRHLEAMRNRETWLLGQVEVVQHIKEDVLRQQQAELNKALGSLQSTCSLLEHSGKSLDMETLECRVREGLAAVSNMNLKPEETNTISFVARNFEFQESIYKFGVVVSDNPLADKQLVSSCEKLKLSSGRKVAFFSPSGTTDDWLMKGECDSSHQDAPKITVAKFNIEDWLQPKAASASSSTENSVVSVLQHSVGHWLDKSQEVAMETEKETEAVDSKDDLEKEDVAIMKNKEADIQRWLIESQKTWPVSPMPSSTMVEYYREVKMSESSKWLKKSGIIMKEDLPTDLIGETYRKIATSSSDQWLRKKSPSTSSSKFLRSVSTQSCSECSCGMSSVCLDTDLQEFDNNSSELSTWLPVKKDDCETSSSITTSLMSSDLPDNSKWLLPQSEGESSFLSTNDSTGINSYKENLAAQSNQHWLQPRGSDESDNKQADKGQGSGIKSYTDSLPVDYDQWLLNQPRDSGICKWLARSSSEKCKECPRMCSKGLFKVFDQVASSKDGWLMSQELY